MTDVIHLLPDAIANQIAAGEVVQRPASVVKELLENSIDARSTRIQLIVREAGKSLIQVVDDGNGMSPTDARMCFERHATSKIRKSDDLFTIRTLGFRGEALASIAAVAQVEMRTRRATDEWGTLIRMEASELKTQEAVACPPGTSILVKNLFYNVPARRNFLRSNAVEMRHILDDFQRVALANPEISFTLHHNDTEIYNLLPGKLSHRIVSIFGKGYREQLAPCQEETSFVTVNGYIGKPEFSKKTRGEQFFFVNNRYVRHNYLHHAVLSAFEGLLPDDSFPFYVLFIDIDPVHIDINVHPTKTEIKFDDERAIYAIMRAAIKKALGVHNISPSLDFESDVNLNPFLQALTRSSSTAPVTSHPPEKSSFEQSVPYDWKTLYQELQNNVLKSPASAERPADVDNGGLPFERDVRSQPADAPVRTDEKPNTFQLHHRFLVTPIKSGLMIVDQQAAHERILYEKYRQTLGTRTGTSQQVLFPPTVALSPVDFQVLTEIADEITSLGFVLRTMDNDSVVVEGIPADIPVGKEKELLEGLIEQFKWNQSKLSLNRNENIARSLARRSALKRGTPLTVPEMNALIDQLFASSNPSYAPDGTPAVVMLNIEKIASFFTP